MTLFHRQSEKIWTNNIFMKINLKQCIIDFRLIVDELWTIMFLHLNFLGQTAAAMTGPGSCCCEPNILSNVDLTMNQCDIQHLCFPPVSRTYSLF